MQKNKWFEKNKVLLKVIEKEKLILKLNLRFL